MPEGYEPGGCRRPHPAPDPYDVKGAVQIHGQCRDMSDHHDEGRAKDVTADIAWAGYTKIGCPPHRLRPTVTA